MKKQIFGILAIMAATFGLLYAANHRSLSVINGSNAIFYNGTADTATTFAWDDAYATNRTYLNPLGTTTTPKSTNATTSVLAPSFNVDVSAWADANGNVPPAAITVAATGVAALTNTVTFTFVRSVNGTDFDTDNKFSFVWTPSGTTQVILTTNVPSTFLNGTRLIRWQNVIIGANPTDNANITVNRIAIGGFVP